MSVRYIRRNATLYAGQVGTANHAPIYLDSDTGTIKVVPGSSGTTEVEIVDVSTAQTLTNKTLTAPTITGAITTGRTIPVTASGGTTRTLTAPNSGSINLFDSAAGITYTLPTPAVGLYYDFVWTVLQTSSAHVVTAVAAVFLTGAVAMFSGEDVTPSNTLGPKMFAGNGSSHVKLSTNATTSGGGIGSWLRFTCVSATLWYVQGVIKSPSGTIITPFST